MRILPGGSQQDDLIEFVGSAETVGIPDLKITGVWPTT
jgi:hypothetical protein